MKLLPAEVRVSYMSTDFIWVSSSLPAASSSAFFPHRPEKLKIKINDFEGVNN
jgi:hypothetical protein